MTKKAPKITPVQIVRSIMREFGKNTIYNNKQKTMRSMKCYAYKPEKDSEMVKKISRALKKAKVPFNVNYTFYGCDVRSMDSVIIQLPL